MAEGLDAPLETFPESYHPLIAKLVHGRYRQRFINISRANSLFISSDKTITTLTKNVQQELLPPIIDEPQEGDKEPPPPVVPLEVVEQAIQSVATKVNWGIDNGVAVYISVSTHICPFAHEHLGRLCMEMGS